MIMINLLAEKKQPKAQAAAPGLKVEMGGGQNLLLVGILLLGAIVAGFWWWTASSTLDDWRRRHEEADREWCDWKTCARRATSTRRRRTSCRARST